MLAQQEAATSDRTACAGLFVGVGCTVVGVHPRLRPSVDCSTNLLLKEELVRLLPT